MSVLLRHQHLTWKIDNGLSVGLDEIRTRAISTHTHCPAIPSIAGPAETASYVAGLEIDLQFGPGEFYLTVTAGIVARERLVNPISGNPVSVGIMVSDERPPDSTRDTHLFDILDA
jgi:hypothetical protein